MVRHLRKSHDGAQLSDNVLQEAEQEPAANKNAEMEVVQESSSAKQIDPIKSTSDLPIKTQSVNNTNLPNASNFKDEKSQNNVSIVKASELKEEQTKPSDSKFDNENDDDEDNFRFGCDQCWFAAETEAQLSEHVKAKHPIVDLTESDQIDNPEMETSDETVKEKITEITNLTTQTKLAAAETVVATPTEQEATETVNDLEVVKTVSQSPTTEKDEPVASKPSEKEEKETEIVSKEAKNVAKGAEIINIDNQTEKESIVLPQQSSTEWAFEEEDEVDSRFQCNFCWFASETSEELSDHFKNSHESNHEDDPAINEDKNESSKSTINESLELTKTSEVEKECNVAIDATNTDMVVETEKTVSHLSTESANQSTDIEIVANESGSESTQTSSKSSEYNPLLNENMDEDVECIEVIQPKEVSTLSHSNEVQTIETEKNKEVSEKMDQSTSECLSISTTAAHVTESVQEETVIDLESTKSNHEPTVIDLESSESVQEPTVIELESIEPVEIPTLIVKESSETVKEFTAIETESTIQESNNPPSNSTDSTTSLQRSDCQMMEIETEQNNEAPLQAIPTQMKDQNEIQEMEVEFTQSKSTSEGSKMASEISSMETVKDSEMVSVESEMLAKSSQKDQNNSEKASKISAEIDFKAELFLESSEMETAAPESLNILYEMDFKTELFRESSEMVPNAPNKVPESSDNENRFNMECNLCDFSTFSSDEMETHLGWEGHFALGQENLCQHCSYMSASKEDLIEHGKTHFHDFSLTEFVCCKCEHKSKNREQMEEHLKEAH